MAKEPEKSELKPGTRVRVFTGALGEILEGPNRKGEFKVMYGSTSVWLPASGLTVVREQKTEKSRPHTPPQAPGTSFTVDLHGLTVAQAEIELERAIDRALRENADEFEIVHGIGTGILSSFVEKYLSKSKYVKRFGKSPYNPGATKVVL